jgi:nucleoside-diphosphate-sugar epimerase
MKSNLSIIAFIITFITLSNPITLQANISTSSYEGVPVLITGGCGFIGSHLVEKLVSLGADVTILDDLSSGNEKHISAVANNVTLIRGSVTNFDSCLTATRNKKIIFHLAAFVSVPASTEDPHLCHNINVIGTQNILEAARINSVKRFVFSSTCAIYGESTQQCDEKTQPAPTSPYGFSKLIGEIYCKEYARVFDMETVAMRYFNVFGPRQNPQGHYAGVVAKFMHNMQNDLPIAIFGDGTQTRDYVPVNTIVEANILLGACEKEHIQGETFNIATGQSSTVLELIDSLKKKYTNYQNEVIFMPSRPGDIKHVSANCSKYRNLYNQITQH